MIDHEQMARELAIFKGRYEEVCRVLWDEENPQPCCQTAFTEALLRTRELMDKSTEVPR